MWEQLLQWDEQTFIYLNSLGTAPYDRFWSVITKISTWIPLFFLFGFLLFKKYHWRGALFRVLALILLAVFITFLTDQVKDLVARLRPNNNEAINGFIRIVRSPRDYSFFSGHASSSFSITVLVFLFLRKKWRWAFLFFIWPIFFCYSRIYVGVHYPLDIIVGALVGTLSGLLFYRLFHHFIGPYLRSSHPE